MKTRRLDGVDGLNKIKCSLHFVKRQQDLLKFREDLALGSCQGATATRNVPASAPQPSKLHAAARLLVLSPAHLSSLGCPDIVFFEVKVGRKGLLYSIAYLAADSNLVSWISAVLFVRFCSLSACKQAHSRFPRIHHNGRHNNQVYNSQLPPI